MTTKLNLFIPITKVDAEKRLVYGIITEEKLDKSGEIMDYSLSKPRFQAWSDGFSKATDGKSAGNLRVMHGSTVAGKFNEIAFDDVNKSVMGVAHVVDNAEWDKVLKGCYTGFSVGGAYGKRIKEGNATRYEALPSEVSLVDNPCVHGATFEVVKADGATELRKFEKELPSEEDQKIEVKARELCKAAGFDPEERLNPEATENAPIMKWHGFVEDAKRDLANPGSVDVNPGVMQKWVAEDGTPFDTKAEAVTHNNLKKAAKNVADITDPATAAMAALDAALNKAEGKTDDVPPGEALLATLSDEAKAFLGKSTGLDATGVENFVKTADPEVVNLILSKKEFTDKKREKLADDGKALPDGSFPIENVSDLKNAVKAYGRAKDKAKAKAHIIDRAKALKATDELPANWDGSTAKKGVIVEGLKKGMYTVSRLASLIQELHCLAQECKWEAEMEDDQSIVPKGLFDSVKELGEQLVTMAEEEIGELVACGMPDDVDELAAFFGPTGAAALVKFIDESKVLVKNADAVVFNKKLEKATKILVKRAPEAGDSHPGMLSKAEGDALRNVVSELTGSLTKAVARIEHLETLPAAEKGVRRVSKSQDNGGEDGNNTGDGGDPIEALAKVLQTVPESERGMTMMKAAMRNGKVLAE